MNSHKKKLLIIMLIIIGLDLLTKILAYYFLTFQSFEKIIGDKIGFYLTYNMSSTGSQVSYFYRNFLNANLAIICYSILIFIMAAYIILISHRNIKKSYINEINIIFYNCV